jgi:AraC-like DNA-binding protein
MARPPMKIDSDMVYNLAAISCSLEEMASVLKCSPAMLHRRFHNVIKSGRAYGRQSLKRKMFELAMAGNTSMLIFLAKNMLNYSDNNRHIH